MMRKERTSPYDVEMEQALLGALLIDDRNYWRLVEAIRLRSDEFYDPLHRRIFDTIEELKGSGADATPLTVAARLINDPGMLEVGGRDYLASLARSAPSLPNCGAYAKELRRSALCRALMGLGEQLAECASDTTDPVYLADMIGEAIYQAAHENAEGGPVLLIDAVHEAIKIADTAAREPTKVRILTGMPTIDEKLGGLFQRTMTVVGAASSMGKSALAAQIAINVARQGHGVLANSIEEGATEYSWRYIAQESGISARTIAEGRIANADFDKIAATPGAFHKLPFLVDDSSHPTVAQIRAKAMAAKRKFGNLGLVVVDHLRLVRTSNPDAHLVDGVEQITRDLKALAKDLDVSVLVVSQLTREFWKRAGNRPSVGDLYGGSAIEQNADHIWFVHREEYYLERGEPKAGTEEYRDWQSACEKAKGKAEVYSVKRRGGPLGRVMLDFEAEMMRFLDPADVRAARMGPSLFGRSDPLDELEDHGGKK